MKKTETKMENVAKCLLVNRIKLLVFLLLLVVGFSCRQTNISKCQARRIGMDTLCKKYGKEEVDKWKPYKMYHTDSTWILSSYHQPPKGYRITRFMEVIIDKNDGKVVGVYFRKL